MTTPNLPHSFWESVTRGALGRCPRCGDAKLFHKWLKSIDRCPSCAQDWTKHRADDFPAYIAIFVTGHILAPVMIMLALDYTLSPFAMFATLIPVALIMMLGMLQPAKGMVIAAQWWHGLHGFTRERLPEASEPESAGKT